MCVIVFAVLEKPGKKLKHKWTVI